MQRRRVGDAGNPEALLSLPAAEPNDQAEHGHDEQQQEDDAQDGAGRLALRPQRRADLGVGVQLLHHESR